MNDEYRCGSCHGVVRLSTVKLSNGDWAAAYVCRHCGESWFPWQLKRDVVWQRREDERRAKHAAKAVAHE